MRVTEWAGIVWRRAKAAGGGSRPYWEDGSKITPIRDGDTPFVKALQVIDRRDGYAAQLARQWRAGAVVATVAAAALGAGWWWQASKAQVQWFGIPIDRMGVLAGPVVVPQKFEVNSAFLADMLKRFVVTAFALSTDVEINKDRYEELKRTLTGQSRKTWSEWWDSQKNSGITERSVRWVSTRPTASPNTFTVTWDETDVKDGAAVARRRVTGDFTVQFREPVNVADAMDLSDNLLVTAMRFAPEGTP